MVYEPAGFQKLAAQGVRFPVLYLLHGTVSNALHYINVGRVGVNLDELLAAGRIRPFLIVMPESSDGSFVDDTEWANTPHGAYESAVLEIVRQVDEHFPTIADRSARAMARSTSGCITSPPSGRLRAGPATSTRTTRGSSRTRRRRTSASTARRPMCPHSPQPPTACPCTSSSTEAGRTG
jgi:hypothetical protein